MRSGSIDSRSSANGRVAVALARHLRQLLFGSDCRSDFLLFDLGNRLSKPHAKASNLIRGHYIVIHILLALLILDKCGFKSSIQAPYSIKTTEKRGQEPKTRSWAKYRIRLSISEAVDSHALWSLLRAFYCLFKRGQYLTSLFEISFGSLAVIPFCTILSRIVLW